MRSYASEPQSMSLMKNRNFLSHHMHSVNLRSVALSSCYGQFCTCSTVQAVTVCSPRPVLSSRPTLNSFKDILNHSIAPHGMKIESFFPFHSSTRIKTLAQQRPCSMEADLDIVFGDFWYGPPDI
jgi:hypothetical protein